MEDVKAGQVYAMKNPDDGSVVRRFEVLYVSPTPDSDFSRYAFFIKIIESDGNFNYGKMYNLSGLELEEEKEVMGVEEFDSIPKRIKHKNEEGKVIAIENALCRVNNPDSVFGSTPYFVQYIHGKGINYHVEEHFEESEVKFA